MGAGDQCIQHTCTPSPVVLLLASLCFVGAVGSPGTGLAACFVAFSQCNQSKGDAAFPQDIPLCSPQHSCQDFVPYPTTEETSTPLCPTPQDVQELGKLLPAGFYARTALLLLSLAAAEETSGACGEGSGGHCRALGLSRALD